MQDVLEQAKEVLQILHDNGHEAYIVGGAVRDSLLGIPVHDVDIATSAKPEEVMALFPRTFPIGIRHGTVLVRHRHIDYEVTTFRSEYGYRDRRHPDRVVFEDSIEKDLARRDFTINAIAMGLNGEYVDPFGGREDIRRRRLRTVGRARERFREDPLRMLRAVRFVGQLDLEPDPELVEALQEERRLIGYVAVERIRDEMTKFLSAKWVARGLKMIRATRLHEVLPYIKERPDLAFEKADSADYTVLETDVERWSAFWLALDVRDQALEAALRTYRFSNKALKAVLSLARAFVARCIREPDRETVYRYGVDAVLAVERLKKAFGLIETVDEAAVRAIADRLPIGNRKDLAVDGHDLQRWLAKEGGPWMREAMEAIERAVVRGEVENEPKAIRKWVNTWLAPKIKS